MAIDMSPAYVKGVRENFGNAQISSTNSMWSAR